MCNVRAVVLRFASLLVKAANSLTSILNSAMKIVVIRHPLSRVWSLRITTHVYWASTTVPSLHSNTVCLLLVLSLPFAVVARTVQRLNGPPTAQQLANGSQLSIV